MDSTAAIAAALCAAVSFAIAAVLQQESALLESQDKTLSVKLLLSLLKRRKWLLGICFLIAGFGLQALALSFGPVALVQPIVITELAFAIPLGIFRRHQRAGVQEWAGIGCVIVGVSLFLLVSSPASGIAQPDAGQWVASMAPIAGVAIALVALGARSQGRRRAMALGAAAGVCFGVLAVLTKSLTEVLSHHAGHALTTWQIYVTIGVGITALVISQSAYQAGPLAYSMPFVAVLEPVVAVLLGDTILNEQVQAGVVDLALEACAAGLACIGIVLLATSRTVLSIYETPTPPEHTRPQPG